MLTSCEWDLDGPAHAPQEACVQKFLVTALSERSPATNVRSYPYNHPYSSKDASQLWESGILRNPVEEGHGILGDLGDGRSEWLASRTSGSAGAAGQMVRRGAASAVARG